MVSSRTDYACELSQVEGGWGHTLEMLRRGEPSHRHLRCEVDLPAQGWHFRRDVSKACGGEWEG